MDKGEISYSKVRQHQRRYLQTYTDEDGMLVIRGRLTPEVGAAVLRALESVTEVSKDVPAETSSHNQRRADAIGMTYDQEGAVLDVGRKTRTIPPAIRRALTHRDRNKEPVFYRPDGRVMPEVPPTPQLEREPVAALMRRNREEGLEIDSRTSRPAWDGEPLDLDWAMAVLLD